MGDEVTLKDDNIPPIHQEMYKLYTQGYMTDITLSCEDGKIFEAHKVILAARSSYFYNLIPKLKGDPVIFLKGIKGAYLEKVLKYVYSGTASVPKVILRSVFDVARSLQIRGLVELSQSELGRGLQGPSGSRNLNLSPAGSYKSDTDSYSRYTSPTTREARENALKQQQQLYEKFSTNSSKNKLGKGAQNTSPKSSKKGNRIIKDDVEEDTETFSFKYQHISDDSDEEDKHRDGDKKRKSKASSKLDKKSVRKESKSSSESESSVDSGKKDYFNSSDSDSSDNSDLDSEDSFNSGSKDATATRKDSTRKKEPSPSLDDYLDDSPTKRNNRRSNKGPTVNGQSIITVQCKVCNFFNLYSTFEFKARKR